jgi:small subunit ribosomal protein S16
MVVKIRLTRIGKKKSPYYRIVAADERRQRDGRIIDTIGNYQPLMKKEKQFNVDEVKALKWLNVGAIPSETVRSIFRKLGIMKKYHEEKVRIKKEHQSLKSEKSIPKTETPPEA